jgi:hypothetical protein
MSRVADLQALMGAYLEYVSMQTADQKRFLDQRATFKGGPAHSTIFSCGPSDLVIFAVVYEIVRKLVDIIKVGVPRGYQHDPRDLCIFG